MAGIGQFTCLELTNYTNEYHVPEELLPWVHGFWSGLNVAGGAKDKKYFDLSVPVADDAVVQERVYAECYADSDRRVFDVALQLYFEFPLAVDQTDPEGPKP